MPSFTKIAILNTFSDLLESTPFDKITVSAIIRACGIGRNTFYYHYQDIYKLLEDWLRRELGKYETDEAEPVWADRVKALLYSCRVNKRKVYHLYDSISRDRIERYIFSSTNDVVYSYISARALGMGVTEQRILAISDICSYAITGYFLRFLWNGMTDDIDRDVDELNAVFNDILEHSLVPAKE